MSRRKSSNKKNKKVRSSDSELNNLNAKLDEELSAETLAKLDFDSDDSSSYGGEIMLGRPRVSRKKKSSLKSDDDDKKPNKSLKNKKMKADVKKDKKNISKNSKKSSSKSDDDIKKTKKEKNKPKKKKSKNAITNKKNYKELRKNSSSSFGTSSSSNIENEKMINIFSCYYNLVWRGKSRAIMKWIYHISDIHLREDRINEFIYIFEEFIKKLKKHVGKNGNESMVVITGDILHKYNSNKKVKNVLIDFLDKISDICHVLFIAGNHDDFTNKDPNNDFYKKTYSGDGKINRKIHYLDRTGVFQFGNILFGVTHCSDKKIFTVKDIDPKIIEQMEKTYKQDDIYFVSLFHCSVHYEGFKKNDFDGYDCALLGDTHSKTFIYDSDHIGFCGSLIQTRVTESRFNHGCLKWELTKNKKNKKKVSTEFIEICNDKYGIFTINLSDEVDELRINKYALVRISLESDAYIGEFNKMKKKLLARYPNLSGVQPLFKSEKSEINKKNVLSREFVIECTRKKRCTTKMFRQFLMSLRNEKNVDINKQCKFHDRIIRKIGEFVRKTSEWEINKLVIKGFLCYNDKKEIILNLNDYEKIIGIFGKNHAGKSAIVELIIYVMYGLQLWRSNLKNYDSNEMICSLELSIGDIKYCITRGHRNGGQYASLVKNNKEINSGMDNVSKKVIELFGTYQNFLNLSLCLQMRNDNERNLAEMSGKDIEKYLMDILGFSDFYYACYDKAKQIEKTCKTVYQKRTIETNFLQTLIDKKILNGVNNKNIEKLHKKIRIVDAKRLPIYMPCIDDEFEKYGVKRNDYDTIDKARTKLKDKISELELKSLRLEKKQNDFFIKEKKKIEYFKKIEKIDNAIERYATKIAVLKEEYPKGHLSIDEKEAQLEILRYIKKEWNGRDLVIKKCNKKITETTIVLKRLDKYKTEYDNYLGQCKKDKKILEKRDNLLKKIGRNELDIQQLHEMKKDYSARKKIDNSKKSELAVCKQYIKMFGDEGAFQFHIVKAFIPKILEYANIFLGKCADFTLNVEYDNKKSNKHSKELKTKLRDAKENVIRFIVVRKDNEDPNADVKSSCGYERKLSNIALRIACSKIVNVPKPKLMVLDESLYGFDKDNKKLFEKILRAISEECGNVIIISHDEYIKDIVETGIELKIISRGNRKLIITKRKKRAPTKKSSKYDPPVRKEPKRKNKSKGKKK